MKTPRACKKCGNIFDTRACKVCLKANSNAHYQRNKDKILNKRAGYRLENKEILKEYRDKNSERARIVSSVYRENNKDRIKKYLEDNKDKISSKYKEYYRLNIDKMLDKTRKYRTLNKDKIKSCSIIYRKNNLIEDRIRSHNRRSIIKQRGTLSIDIAEKLLILQNNKCPCCNKSLSNGYELDHIIPLALGGLNIDSNIQLLTKKCNRQKHMKHPVDFMRSRGFLI